jgi:hypothetical protein
VQDAIIAGVDYSPNTHIREATGQTPFGEVLLDYMTSRRPIPWSTGRLAHELTRRIPNIRRQTVAFWIHHNTTPPIETILTVLAILNIPLAALVDAYARHGVDVPPIGEANPNIPPYATPGSPDHPMNPNLNPRSGSISDTLQRNEMARAAREAEITARAEARRQQEWEEMIAHTRTTMAAAGFPETMIQATITTIEQKRDDINPLQRYIEAEHSNPTPTPASPSPANEPSEKPTTPPARRWS